MQKANEMIDKLPAGLYVVATPIGNLGDITFRALDTLKKADMIAAEDTRQTHKLLQHFGIKANVVSSHAHNEDKTCTFIAEQIEKGMSVALVSDAGTPAVSDPGAFVVHHVRNLGLPVFAIPGANAAVAAISVAGILSSHFLFYGFLPHQSSARKTIIEALSTQDWPVVFYESPHRIKDTLSDLESTFGASRQFVVAKELTKVFEQVITGHPSDLLEWLTDEKCRGEFVLIMLPFVKHDKEENDQEARRLLTILLNELPLKQAVGLAVEITKQKKKPLYALALEIAENKK